MAGIVRRDRWILERLRAGGSSLILLWWTSMMSGLLLSRPPCRSVRCSGSRDSRRWRRPFAILAGFVQMLRLLRWVYVVPALARAYADPTLGPKQREGSPVGFEGRVNIQGDRPGEPGEVDTARGRHTTLGQ
jgi:hypothetical protein